MKPPLDITSKISVAVGVVITVFLSTLFQHKGPLIIPIVLGVIVACNIAKDRKFLVSIYIALISNAILFVTALYFLVGIENLKDEFLRILINFVVAPALGYGYSRRDRDGS